MEKTTLFVHVILPIPIHRLYTYRVPFNWNEEVMVGQRVVVQFGKSKRYTALVRSIDEIPPKAYEAKYIESILDKEPVVNEKQFELWDWMSDYYMCTLGEVMNAALPSGLKLSSETTLVFNPSFDAHESLTDKEYLIIEALEVRNVLSIKEVSAIVDQKTVYPLIKSLIEKKAVMVEEELKERYKPKIETHVCLTPFAQDEANLKEFFNQLEKKAPKQLELLMGFLHLTRHCDKASREIKKALLMKSMEGGEAAFNALIKKEIFEVHEIESGRLEQVTDKTNKSKQLNEFQEQAYLEIKKSFEEKNVALLHGVTSSGKTEIYVKLIEETLAEGKQVLYLLPEIALTTQIINRLRKYFGNKVGVYHSRYNENERVEVWKRVLLNPGTTEHGISDFKVILGARSALFLPFTNLGLIIVDEEHENSYKQYDPAPRYNARDAAIILAHIHGSKTLLGSATPSLESYYNAQTGKYGFIELNQRFGGVQMPEIIVADVQEETRKKTMKSHFSTLLMNHLKQALDDKKQVILFQNRRGYAPVLNCQLCGWTPGCTQCDVSLTYHKHIHQLRCHYCGYNQKPPKVCEACGNPEVKMKGFGTEKIEDELAIFFPMVKVKRMDFDTTRSKNSYRQIISDFEERQIDVLVGTQMVTKGLDFDNVALVGIMSADSMLGFPDFRAYERSYQLMAQVSGRAGRKEKRGKVVIQSFNPTHSIIRNVIANDYFTMYTNEILDRKNFHYPPFYRLVALTLRNKDINVVNAGANYLADGLKQHFGNRVLGPEFPAVARIRNLYNKNILLKVERNASVSKVKEVLHVLLTEFKIHQDYKGIRVLIDVDPL